MIIPVNAICDPTDRSICRATMMKTMPQAMIAVTQVWIDRLYRLRGLRKMPSVANASRPQTRTSAITSDEKRGSNPALSNQERIYLQAGGAFAASTPWQTWAFVAQPA